MSNDSYIDVGIIAALFALLVFAIWLNQPRDPS